MANLPDFEDLVKELDQFEREAKALQDRIAEFMDSARQPAEDDGQYAPEGAGIIARVEAQGSAEAAD